MTSHHTKQQHTTTEHTTPHRITLLHTTSQEPTLHHTSSTPPRHTARHHTTPTHTHAHAHTHTLTHTNKHTYTHTHTPTHHTPARTAHAFPNSFRNARCQEAVPSRGCDDEQLCFRVQLLRSSSFSKTFGKQLPILQPPRFFRNICTRRSCNDGSCFSKMF